MGALCILEKPREGSLSEGKEIINGVRHKSKYPLDNAKVVN